MDFTSYNDADLLEFMSMQSRESETAHAAFHELHRRHVKYLFATACRSFGSIVGGDEGVRDLVQDALFKAWVWAGKHEGDAPAFATFRFSDGEVGRRRVRAWLGRIVENCLRDILRNRERNPEAALIDDMPDQRAGIRAPSPEVVARCETLLASLNDSEREAIRLSLPCYDPATGTFVFKSGEAEAIAKSIGTTVDNLRQRRHRAIARLRAGAEPAQAAAARSGGKR